MAKRAYLKGITCLLLLLACCSSYAVRLPAALAQHPPLLQLQGLAASRIEAEAVDGHAYQEQHILRPTTAAAGPSLRLVQLFVATLAGGVCVGYIRARRHHARKRVHHRKQAHAFRRIRAPTVS